MSKNYDFLKAKKQIEEKKREIISASIGMQEDWFWTAEEVWNREDQYLLNLETVKVIAGICGSDWATPILKLELLDESTLEIPCFIGESSGKRPFWV